MFKSVCEATVGEAECMPTWELPMDHVSIALIIQTFVNNYLGATSAFLRGEKAPSTLSIVCTTLIVLADILS